MKFFFKYFFKTVRLVVGPMLLLGEKLNPPQGVVRPPEEQEQIDQQCQALALYQFRTCPF